MSMLDQEWIGKAMFESAQLLRSSLHINYIPPSTAPIHQFRTPVICWMPRRFWQFEFSCVKCKGKLKSKGPYPHVRHVYTMKGCSYLVGEYMGCKASDCNSTYISWDQRILEQLPSHFRCRLTVCLTYKYACESSVVSFLRSRTQGNSPTAFQNILLEIHSEEYLRKCQVYLAECARDKSSRARLHLPPLEYARPPEFKGLPKAAWFLVVYVRDVFERLSVIKCSLASVYGSILKIDSTKKTVKKLAGHAQGSASWVTNVGNERGEVLSVVVTSSESSRSLQPMVDGLVARYERASQAPPVVIYTDRDCCSTATRPKISALFGAWPQLKVRLDLWHWIRRLAAGCTAESHPLYSVFMGRLSYCIFVWDDEDLKLLRRAKKAELKLKGRSHKQ